MTRRDVLKGAVGLATLGAGSALAADLPADVAGNSGPRSERERVAIVGAAWEMAAAYFVPALSASTSSRRDPRSAVTAIRR